MKMVEEFRSSIQLKLLDRKHFHRLMKEEEEKLSAASNRTKILVEAQKIFQEAAEITQKQAHERIASVVTSCLSDVFQEEAYEFKLDFQQKRGKTEAVIILSRNGVELEDPVNEAGGGIVDVASFALRVACLMSSIPRKRKVLLLDEPFKFINGDKYQSRVGSMLLSLSVRLGVQIVQVTQRS